MTERIVRYTPEELRKMKGESDWEKIDRTLLKKYAGWSCFIALLHCIASLPCLLDQMKR
jgi:hypothetical protein